MDGNSLTKQFFFAESVTMLVKWLRDRKFKTQERVERGYLINDNHQLYSHADLRNIGSHAAEDVPPGAMAFLEVNLTGAGSEKLVQTLEQGITERELTSIQPTLAV